MNTPAHLLLGAAVMGRKEAPRLMWAAMLGGLLPDLSLYLMGGVSIYVLGIPPMVVFRELYYSAPWQTVFAVDNSFFVWGALAGLAVWRRSGWGIALTGAAILHLCLDLPLHHDDGRAHFWPLTRWIFESPYSYWDTRHGAGWIGPAEALVAAASALVILWRRPGPPMIAATLALLVAEGLSVSSFLFRLLAG